MHLNRVFDFAPWRPYNACWLPRDVIVRLLMMFDYDKDKIDQAVLPMLCLVLHDVDKFDARA